MADRDNSKRTHKRILIAGFTTGGLVIAMAIGAVSGAGAYAFKYGEGLSYFSKDPQACVNCHIMDSQFDSWQKSSHHTSASCVDCHLPHSTIPKLASKAENGWLHSKGFTMQDFHEPIFLREKSRETLEHNCRDCHDGLMHGSVPMPANRPDEAINCLHCHRSAGHGPTTGMGKFDSNEIETYLEKLR